MRLRKTLNSYQQGDCHMIFFDIDGTSHEIVTMI